MFRHLDARIAISLVMYIFGQMVYSWIRIKMKTLVHFIRLMRKKVLQRSFNIQPKTSSFANILNFG